MHGWDTSRVGVGVYARSAFCDFSISVASQALSLIDGTCAFEA
jgi:hypothetical protein